MLQTGKFFPTSPNTHPQHPSHKSWAVNNVLLLGQSVMVHHHLTLYACVAIITSLSRECILRMAYHLPESKSLPKYFLLLPHLERPGIRL